MSHTNVPPDGNFTRLDRVTRRQRRVTYLNVMAMTLLTGGSVFALLALF